LFPAHAGKALFAGNGTAIGKMSNAASASTGRKGWQNTLKFKEPRATGLAVSATLREDFWF
jgi:hypothetical protein